MFFSKSSSRYPCWWIHPDSARPKPCALNPEIHDSGLLILWRQSWRNSLSASSVASAGSNFSCHRHIRLSTDSVMELFSPHRFYLLGAWFWRCNPANDSRSSVVREESSSPLWRLLPWALVGWVHPTRPGRGQRTSSQAVLSWYK